jgi:hypothetical protein
MGNTQREIRFSVTVRKSDRWTPEHLKACAESEAHGYDDWVVAQLEDVMRIAGARFMADNPDLFAYQDLV